MNRRFDMCSCGWIGKDFSVHHEDTKFDDKVHVETSPLKVILDILERPY